MNHSFNSKQIGTVTAAYQCFDRLFCRLRLLLVAAAVAALLGCATDENGKNNGFFTSGSREADQRASQRMARAEQLAGPGEGNGDEKPAQTEDKQTLYERIGGHDGVVAIVNDFTARALEDPRVNWTRKGVRRGGFLFGLGRGESVAWTPNPEAVEELKKHLVQFLSLAAGGPARYDGRDMKSVHANMEITNTEFDAAVGDLKATLDKLQIADREQKELLAIVETTRPQIVTVR